MAHFYTVYSRKTGGPPKLQITGIDFPQPGFRSAQRVILTVHFPVFYAEAYYVSFEYNAIAKKQETV